MPAHDQILSVAQMRAAEEALIAEGSSVEALMDRAGQGAADWVWRVAARHRVTVVCGPGNNGGDGYVIAEAIRARGGDAAVVAAYEPRSSAARNARQRFTGQVLGRDAQVRGDVLVDCLFGSGLARALSEEDQGLLAHLAADHRHRIAIDVPSGVAADTGALLAALPRFDLTIALGAWKPAHFLMLAMALMGERRLVDIGVAAMPGTAHVLARPCLHAPAADSHKYRRGLVQIVGGTMPGAAALAAEAALRAGAGYVRLSAPERASASHAILQSRTLDFDKAKAVLVGPGLGRDADARNRLSEAMNSGVPLVADADALGLLAQDGFGHRDRPPAIITPHDGEFERLFGPGAGSKIDRARSAAAECGAVIVYKGPDTVIAAPDGRAAVASQGTSWLSTAGTGDVLAGLCVSRLAVTGEPFASACEAVWLHGEAARLAGPAFAADDLVAHIPSALEVCL